MNKKQLEIIFMGAVKKASKGDVILYDERIEQVINLTEEAIRKRESYRFWKELGEYGVPCCGLMAELLGKHNKEFEKEVEHVTSRGDESLNQELLRALDLHFRCDCLACSKSKLDKLEGCDEMNDCEVAKTYLKLKELIEKVK